MLCRYSLLQCTTLVRYLRRFPSQPTGEKAVWYTSWSVKKWFGRRRTSFFYTSAANMHILFFILKKTETETFMQSTLFISRPHDSRW